MGLSKGALTCGTRADSCTRTIPSSLLPPTHKVSGVKTEPVNDDHYLLHEPDSPSTDLDSSRTNSEADPDELSPEEWLAELDRRLEVVAAAQQKGDFSCSPATAPEPSIVVKVEESDNGRFLADQERISRCRGIVSSPPTPIAEEYALWRRRHGFADHESRTPRSKSLAWSQSGRRWLLLPIGPSTGSTTPVLTVDKLDEPERTYTRWRIEHVIHEHLHMLETIADTGASIPRWLRGHTTTDSEPSARPSTACYPSAAVRVKATVVDETLFRAAFADIMRNSDLPDGLYWRLSRGGFYVSMYSPTRHWSDGPEADPAPDYPADGDDLRTIHELHQSFVLAKFRVHYQRCYHVGAPAHVLMGVKVAYKTSLDTLMAPSYVQAWRVNRPGKRVAELLAKLRKEKYVALYKEQLGATLKKLVEHQDGEDTEDITNALRMLGFVHMEDYTEEDDMIYPRDVAGKNGQGTYNLGRRPASGRDVF